jgi:hypothetical protein
MYLPLLIARREGYLTILKRGRVSVRGSLPDVTIASLAMGVVGACFA